MTSDLTSAGWLDCLLFQNITEEEKTLLSKYMVQKSYPINYLFVQSGSSNSIMFFLEQGHVSVEKENPKTKKDVEVAELGPGSIFGEMSSLLKTPATASIRSKEVVHVLEWNVTDLVSSNLMHKLIRNAGVLLAEKVTENNKRAVQGLQQKIEEMEYRERFSNFLTKIFIGMALYTFSLEALRKLSHQLISNSLVSSGVILMLAFLLYVILRQSKLPMDFYGITWERPWQQIKIGISMTFPFMIIAFLLKCLWSYLDPVQVPHVFQPEVVMENPLSFTWVYHGALIALYSLLTVAQEFIARSGMQASLSLIYGEATSASRWKAILVSNLLFGASHSHLGMMFSALAFLAGLFWGWMFSKQRSLLAVSASHIVLGVWVVFILGIPT
jgi:CRP-like cAMP-binding protein